MPISFDRALRDFSGQRWSACLGSAGVVAPVSAQPAEAPSYRASQDFSGQDSLLVADCQLNAPKYDGDPNGNGGCLEPSIETEKSLFVLS